MKPTLLCIFAHPDDEAFGPAGTIATFAKTHDVYLMCVTNGNDPGTAEDLTEIRKQELLSSAKILGIKQVFFLGYPDGSLSNSLYHEIADKIKAKIEAFKPEILLTFEPRGVSGHLDHIALSMITTFTFAKSSIPKELWYYCISTAEADSFRRDYFIYMPEGYDLSQINKTITISSVWDQKVTAMKAHVSQSKDGEKILKKLQTLPKKEYFLVKSRD